MRRIPCTLVLAMWCSLGCGEDPKSDDNTPPAGPQCSDGVDNDGDGDVDFPADLGCEAAADDTEDGLPKPACDDNRDNDGDGKTDFPDDPGCALALDDGEEDDCPDGETCPECGNGRDDNGDGAADYPDDPGCEAASDTTEFLEDPAACGGGLVIEGLPPTGMTTGTLDGSSTSQLVTPCGGGAGASAVAYLFHLAEPKVMVATTDLAGTMTDTVLDLRGADCDDAGAHLACNDDAGEGQASTLTASLPAGSYYLIVEGHDASVTGAYALSVQFLAGEGTMCTATSDCGPGLVCRTPAGGSQMICTKPVCSDGVDDDGDTKIDFPDDPGCGDPADATEDDDCPSGPDCPACADGADNDGDGDIDYPADPACTAASGNSEACAGELDAIEQLVAPTTTSSLVGATDDHDPSCGFDLGPDKLFTLDVPDLTSLTIDTNGSDFDTILSLLDTTCAEPSLACDDDGGDGFQSLITRGAVAAGQYVVAVDAIDDLEPLGAFTINIRGTLVDGASCEGALAQAGALVCGPGHACKGAVGSRTCAPADCNDGIDNNQDGTIDFPNDPGCASPSDNAEDTVCPGVDCPACADGLDNDDDGQIDFPLDTGCVSAAADNEGCAGELDPIVDLVAPATAGTLTGASDDHDPSCSTADGPDLIYNLEIPTLASLTLDTIGSDTDAVLSLMASTCSEPSLACDDDGGGSGDSRIARSFIAGGTYTVAVDPGTTTVGDFVLNLHGEIVPFGSCENALVTSGALTCTQGFACQGAAGSRICLPSQCLDGVDNNGDGKTDFPNDPGCASPSDDEEDTVCPGAQCPVCSDGIDNDGDGQTDFPADVSCLAAGGDNEACTQSEPIPELVQGVTTGTTAGQTNDFFPSCGSSVHSAPDVAFRLELPAMATLGLNLQASFDAVHSLLGATCGGTPLGCVDGNDLDLTGVAAGTYYLVIDGFDTELGTWTLTATGTVEPGQSCEGALFQAGAFKCTDGFFCAGTAGSRTCIVTPCNDGIDNNGDGTIDFPNDPGCDSLSDDVEQTVCPGPSCPVCSNASDDDGDSLVDYPADFGCAAAGADSEVFCPIETTPGMVAITMPQTAGTMAVPATDDYDQPCQSSTGNDVAFGLQLPVPVETLVIDTIGSATSDTVVSFWDASCGAPLGCDDDGDPDSNRSLLTLTDVPAGNYAVQVDSFSSANNGAFVLNVHGTVAAGTDCTSPLFASGVLACTAGTTCTSGICQ